MRLSRRAFLGGGVGLAFAEARAEGLRLTAAPLAGALGYNGASPGPVLRGKVGAPMRLTLVNKLALPTSLRLPGAPGGFAGLTEPALAPGAEREIAVTPTAAGFGLYGPFGPPAAAGEPGLFGALVIDELVPPEVDLDAVVIFSGADAERLRVNGEAAPLKLTARLGARVRLRLANASPDLLLSFRASGAAVEIVAVDGQPCDPFAPRDGEIPICASARFELMFDLAGTFDLVLRGAPERPALRIEPRGEPVGKRAPIAALPANPRLPAEIALERARQVRVVVSGAAPAGYRLNGVGGAAWPEKPMFKVARGTPVSLTLVNQTAEPQTLRLEGHAARLLHALDDGWDPYWRDALFVVPGQTLHAAFVADNPGKWPLASASPERRAQGMAGWFWVTP